MLKPEMYMVPIAFNGNCEYFAQFLQVLTYRIFILLTCKLIKIVFDSKNLVKWHTSQVISGIWFYLNPPGRALKVVML